MTRIDEYQPNCCLISLEKLVYVKVSKSSEYFAKIVYLILSYAVEVTCNFQQLVLIRKAINAKKYFVS